MDLENNMNHVDLTRDMCRIAVNLGKTSSFERCIHILTIFSRFSLNRTTLNRIFKQSKIFILTLAVITFFLD